MKKYKVLWNGEYLETRFNTRDDAEFYASEKYEIAKEEIDKARAKDTHGTFWDDYPEYKIVEYKTSEIEEWKQDLRYSVDSYLTNPYDSIDPPFQNADRPPCPYCPSTMIYKTNKSEKSYWECPSCGFIFWQDDLYDY